MTFGPAFISRGSQGVIIETSQPNLGRYFTSPAVRVPAPGVGYCVDTSNNVFIERAVYANLVLCQPRSEYRVESAGGPTRALSTTGP